MRSLPVTGVLRNHYINVLKYGHLGKKHSEWLDHYIIKKLINILLHYIFLNYIIGQEKI